MSEELVLKLTEYKRYIKKLLSIIVVLIFFGTYNYLDFLYKTTWIVSVNGLDSLLSINRTSNLDNAFFTVKYMAY